MKSFCTHLTGTFPLLSVRVSIESGGGEAQNITVQKAHGCSFLMVVDYLKGEGGGMSGLSRRRWEVCDSHQVTGLFRARWAGRRPLSAEPSLAAAAAATWRWMEASGEPGPNPGLHSLPAQTHSGAFHTASPCRLRDSCSGRCWYTSRHFGSAGVRCHTPVLRWKQCKDRREAWEFNTQTSAAWHFIWSVRWCIRKIELSIQREKKPPITTESWMIANCGIFYFVLIKTRCSSSKVLPHFIPWSLKGMCFDKYAY